MNRQRGKRAVVLSIAAIALLSLAGCGDAAPPLLPRDTVVPVSVVTEYFPDVTTEASTGPNETSVGKPIASRSVVPKCSRRRGPHASRFLRMGLR
jgi:predicted small lipoprotein YifL